MIKEKEKIEENNIKLHSSKKEKNQKNKIESSLNIKNNILSTKLEQEENKLQNEIIENNKIIQDDENSIEINENIIDTENINLKIDQIDSKEENINSEFNQIEQNTSFNITILKIIGILIIILFTLILLLFGGFTIYNYKNNETIAKGIYIDNINVSKLTPSEAKTKLVEYYFEKLSNDITLNHNDYTTYIKTSEINLNFDIDSAVNYAYQLGKTHNIFIDNYQIFNLLINGIEITPTYTLNEEALTSFLNTASTELPDAVIESEHHIDGKNLIITPGSDGQTIDIQTTINIIKNKIQDLSYINELIELSTIAQNPKPIDIENIYNNIHSDAKDAYYTTDPFTVYPSSTGIDFAISLDEAKELVQTTTGEITIPLKILYPNITTNMIGQEAFPDLLATFSTKYAASNTDRTTNLRLAANKINGYVLLPGDTFSYNTVVGPRTVSAGYKEAPIYENGEVVPGLGGGICQISTTLYNAALFANLEIVELYNHQFVPSYVSAGRDATVVYGVKDFKFRNSRNYPIKITCSVSNGTATFKIWGLKSETEYDVNVYANITSKTSSYIKSSTYRTLKLNNQIISTEHITNSTYKVH